MSVSNDSQAIRKLSALKGHLTRTIKPIRLLLDAESSEVVPSDALAALSRMHTARERLEECLLESIEILSTSQYQEAESTIENMSEECDDLSKNLSIIIQNVNGPTPKKIDIALRPEKLSPSSSLAQFRSWKENFGVFYSANRMERLPLLEQQGYLRSCLELQLQQHLQTSINHGTPIFGPDGCIDKIHAIFLQAVPLLTRRFQFFQCNQLDGEKFSDGMVRLQLLGNEADLSQFSEEDLYTMRFITGTSDANLREEFLRKGQSSRDELVQIAKAWESAKSVSDSLSSSVAAISVYKKRQAQNGQPMSQTSPVSTSRNLDELRDRCFGCGRPRSAHSRSSCPAREVVCFRCNKEGHFSRVCTMGKIRPAFNPQHHNSRFDNSQQNSTGLKTWSTQRQSANQVVVGEYESEEIANRTVFVDMICSTKNATPTVRIKVCLDDGSSFTCEAIPDTGATETLIPESLAVRLTRLISETERKYAVCELETLAIHWAMRKCRLFLEGITFTVITDHKPLVSIFNGNNVPAISNARIQRLVANLAEFTFQVEWTPGKVHQIADALSRSPVFSAEPKVEDVLVSAIRIAAPQLDQSLDFLTQAADADENYQRIIKALLNDQCVGNLPSDHPGRQYRAQWSDISFDEVHRLLVFHNRIIVPLSARHHILKLLHSPHQGISKTRLNAQALYFWPGLSKDIACIISSCPLCMEARPSQAHEECISTVAKHPFEHVSVDLFVLRGNQYIVLVDRFSNWPLVSKLTRLDTTSITAILQDWFCDYGSPKTIRTDGGPQFRGPFSTFCKAHNIFHELSSPYNPRSNGHAESAVKSMKALLSKCTSWAEFRVGLREWRNTPSTHGLSPAQLLFNRRQRTTVPATQEAYSPVSKDELATHLAKVRSGMETSQAYANRTHKPLPPLEPKTQVRIQNPVSKKWSDRGVVIKARSDGRSYHITSNNRDLIRNRIHLKPIPEEEVEVMLRIGSTGLNDRTTHPDATPPTIESPSSSTSIPRRSARIANMPRKTWRV